METEKIGFFKRIKMAIFNLEKYSIFANERFSKALKYLFLIILIATIFLAIASTVQVSEEVGKLIDFVKSEEFPNFELKDGNLSSDKILNSYDKEYNGRLIIDTTEGLPEEKLEEYKNLGKESNYSVVLLKDKIVYKLDGNTDNWLETTYNNVTSLAGIEDLTKDKLVNDFLNNDILFKIRMVLFVYAFMTILLLNIITLFEDILIVGIFGWLASKISRVPLGFVKNMSLAIYSLTLSIILSTIYSIVYSFTGFEIKYFEVMYMIIAYIYVEKLNAASGDAVRFDQVLMLDSKVGNPYLTNVTVEGEVLKPEEEKEEDSQEENKDEKKKKLPENKDKENEEKDTKQENNEDSDKK